MTVRTTRSVVTDIVIECRECDFWANVGAHASLAALARRHCEKTGHVVGISRTRVTELRRVP